MLAYFLPIAVVAIVLSLISLASYFISKMVYNRQVREGHKPASKAAVFIFSFLLIGAAIVLLLIYNIRLGR
jgi:hypothetical protein